MNKPRIGDIMEIPTSKGLAYAQFTHNHREYGELMRVFDALFVERPDLSAVVNSPVRFMAFFPLGPAVRRGIFKIVGNQAVAPQNLAFPLFRSKGLEDLTTGQAPWWLWDGEAEWKIGALAPEQKKLPIRGVWNDTLLIERIEQGWTADHDTSNDPHRPA